MHPQIYLNPLAIGAVVVANFILGFLWYGPLFGKAWGRLMGFPPDFKPAPGQMVKAMLLSILGSILIAFVLAHIVSVWRPSSWRLGPDEAAWKYGFTSALFTWLGFFVPVLFNSVGWEGKSWKLFGINAAYHFVTLQVAGAILTHWR